MKGMYMVKAAMVGHTAAAVILQLLEDVLEAGWGRLTWRH